MTPAPDVGPAARHAMRTALDAALRGPRGANPLVGAVLTDAEGTVLHVGHHRGAGTPHAEADVIARARDAGTNLRRTTLFVSLEPCSHTGRTGPCAHAIYEVGIPEVVYAETDTTPHGAGGAAFLSGHGVTVRGGLLAEEAHAINRRWWHAQETRRPFVTAKIASTLDGRIAAPDGTSQWITSTAARSHGHALRRRVDTILCGTGTARADDPRLTARNDDGQESESQPLRAVMGLRGIPENAALNRGEGHVRLATRDPATALRRLHDRGTRHVLIEGGPGIITAFLRAGLVDELYWYQAPTLLGDGADAVGSLGATTLGEAQGWRYDPAGSEADGTAGGVARIGPDLLTHLQPHDREV